MSLTYKDLKSHATVYIDDDDQLLSDALDDAIAYAENEINRPILTDPRTKYFDCFDDPLILESNLVSVTQIDYIDTSGAQQTLANTEYQVVTSALIGYVARAYSGDSLVVWPDTRTQAEAVIVTYVAGYATIPDGLKRGILMVGAHFYENREATTERRMDEVPLGAQRIFHQYRRPTL